MKVDFVAEVSSNHNRDLQRSKDFIKIASEIGCSGVKFQLFKIDKLFAPEILTKSAEHRRRGDWELPLEFIPELSEYAHSLGLHFSCTPFYLEAVKELYPYVDFYKIASYELLWKELFNACLNTGKPLVFSTGMATLEEIKQALIWSQNRKTKDITVLKCTSAYPTPVSDANLRAITTFRKAFQQYNSEFNLHYGWSDHTVSTAVILRAIFHYNVNFVEFHLDLDGKGEEYKSGHCWLPHEIEKVIHLAKEGFNADGNGEIKPMSSEISDRDWRTDPSDGLRPLKNIRNLF